MHINQTEEGDVLQLLTNIKQSMHIANIKDTIIEIDKILKTVDKKPEIIKNYEILKHKFEYSRNHIFDYDKDGKHYLISYREVKEIKEGKYNDNYEGIPLDNMEDTINAVEEKTKEKMGDLEIEIEEIKTKL